MTFRRMAPLYLLRRTGGQALRLRPIVSQFWGARRLILETSVAEAGLQMGSPLSTPRRTATSTSCRAMGRAHTSWRQREALETGTSAGRQTAEPSGFPEMAHFGRWRRADPTFARYSPVGVPRTTNAAGNGLLMENTLSLLPDLLVPYPSYGRSMSDPSYSGGIRQNRFDWHRVQSNGVFLFSAKMERKSLPGELPAAASWSVSTRSRTCFSLSSGASPPNGSPSPKTASLLPTFPFLTAFSGGPTQTEANACN